MLEQLIGRKFYLEKHLKAPLLEERESYIQSWAEKGLAKSTLKGIADYTLRIVEYLHLKDTEHVFSLGEVEKAALEWAELQINHPMKRAFSKTGKERFTWIAIHWLKRLHRLEPLPEESVPLFCHLFERRHALRHHTFAPLLQERLLYLQYWSDHGAKVCTLRRQAQYLLQVMEYLQFFSLREVTMEEIKKAAEIWASNETIRKRKGGYSRFARARFINDATLWLHMLNCLKRPKAEPFPFQDHLNRYLEYLLQDQGLSENTIYSLFFQLKDFFSSIREECQGLSMLTPLMIDGILIKKHEQGGYARVSVQEYASVIRSFLRYAETQQWCSEGLANTVKAPRVYRQESLPSSPSWEDIKKVVKGSYTDHPTDIRDHAILQILVVYGLRCSEIAGLRLQDLDWKRERFYLRRAKSLNSQVFPLSSSVGNALIRYLQEVRPSDCRLQEVFVCRRAPYRPLSTSAVYQIVNRRLKPLNLNIKHQGPHCLRHACATRLINKGFSLKEISDHLGHQNLDTTRIYAKVDLSNLRKVAEMNWEGLL